eukprot:235894-Chlamydomonas_euryale.AAC.4
MSVSVQLLSVLQLRLTGGLSSHPSLTCQPASLNPPPTHPPQVWHAPGEPSQYAAVAAVGQPGKHVPRRILGAGLPPAAVAFATLRRSPLGAQSR